MLLLSLAGVGLFLSAWWVCAQIARDNRQAEIRRLKQDAYTQERRDHLKEFQRGFPGDRR